MRACEDVVMIMSKCNTIAALSITHLLPSSIKVSFGQTRNIFNAAHYNHDQGTTIYL